MRRRLLPAFFLCCAALLRADPTGDAAVGLFKAKRYPEARAAFEQITAADPKNAAAHYYLGVLALRRNDDDESIRQLEEATALDPRNSDYFADLGAAYGSAATKASLFSKMGLAQKCQGALEHSVELNPDNLAARNGLVSYYRTAPSFVGGGLSKAYDQAGEIRKRDPLMGAIVLSQLYVSEEKYEPAFAILEEVLKTKPDAYIALYSIGRIAAQSGQHLERGEQALRRCLALTPGKGEPGHAPVEWRLGNLAEKRGSPAAARAAYEAALKIDPGFTQAKDSLSKLK